MYQLSVRLALQTSVSQLTTFSETKLQTEFVNHGIIPVLLALSIETSNGNIYNDFSIMLQPHKIDGELAEMEVVVFQDGLDEDGNPEHSARLFDCTVNRYAMTNMQLVKCSLHVAGDYIKFALTGRE